MNWWMLASALVILLTPTLIGSEDLAAYLRGGNVATISRISQRTAWAYPPYGWSVCFLLGLLCGHLFVTNDAPAPLPRWFSFGLFVVVPYLVAVTTLALGVWHPASLPLADASRDYPLTTVIVVLALGALVGARLLHQTGE